MKLSSLTGLDGILESVKPFHKITIGLILIASNSVQTVLLEIFEPAINVYFSFLITFPLTLGLTIVSLIIINTNWSKVTLPQVLVAPMLISLLFAGLIEIAKSYGMEEKGVAHEVGQKMPNTGKTVNPQTLTTIQSLPSVDSGSGNFSKTMLDEGKGFNKSSETNSDTNHNFFVKWILLIVAGIVRLVNQFKDFYLLYRPVHFFSGVFIAGAFTYYIQTKIVDRYLIIKKKKSDTLV